MRKAIKKILKMGSGCLQLFLSFVCFLIVAVVAYVYFVPAIKIIVGTIVWFVAIFTMLATFIGGIDDLSNDRFFKWLCKKTGVDEDVYR